MRKNPIDLEKNLLPGKTQVNNNKGFAILKVQPDEFESISILRKSHIANTIPALIDDEGLTRYFLPDEFTVQFGREVSKEEIETILSETHAQIIKEHRTPGYYTLAVPEGKGLFEMLNTFSNFKEVSFAEPSEIATDDFDMVYTAKDPDFVKQWGLYNSGQTVNGVIGYKDIDAGVAKAWDITMGKPNIIVAVIDSGVDTDHPDLKDNLLLDATSDLDFSSQDSTFPEDTNGHGTQVCGVIAAEDNAIGIIGVAPHCKIMPIRIDGRLGMSQNQYQ